jgi:hypothetical protein
VRDSNGDEIATCAIAAQLLAAKANARLIAAAPDLLAALKAMLDHLQIPLTQRMDADALNAWTAARAAIAKAVEVSHGQGD